MKKFRARILFSLVVGLIAFGALLVNFVVQATVLVDDTFADANSANQDLPNNSLQVFKARSATARNTTVGNAEFDMTTTGTSSEAFWAFFTNSGAPVTLNVGDSVSLSATFSLTGFVGTGQDVRFGFFDSKATRTTADLTGGQNHVSFGDDTGYAAQYYASGSGSPFVLYRRDVVSPTPITNPFNSFTNAGFTTLTGSGASARQPLTSGTQYTYNYTVTRLSATETQVTVAVTGGSLSGLTYTATETSATPYNTFDSFTFRIGGNGFATKWTFHRLKVDFNPAAPVITTQPAPLSQTVSVGANVQYSVGASGSALSYQWLKDSNPIAGNPSATTATLLLNNVQTTDTGVYTVNVSNAGGTTPSNPVTLNVTSGPTDPPPVINQQPQNTTAVINTPASLSVQATGPNMTYQWFKDGNLIGGATSATLSFPSVSLSDVGNYTVNVSNGGGTIPSDAARLTVVSAMQATSFDPGGATGVCVDKILNITFDQAPKVGASGQLRVYTGAGVLVDTIDLAASPQTKTIAGTSFRYLPIITSGNTASVYLHNQLAYNQTFYVVMDAGVLTDAANVPFVGFSNPNTFRFTTRPSAPPAGASVLTVNADGSGDFCTIQGAVDFVPAGNAQRVVVNVKNGTYQEIVNVPSSKPLITVRGESRAGTIQKYPNNNNLNPSTTTRPSFNVNSGANDFTLENITLQNSTPQGGSQAEAFRSYALRTTVNSVNLLSYQDTILTQGSAFFANSYVEGDVDFMWGTGNTFFKNTELKMMRENLGYYTQIRNGSGAYGNVYVGCRFTRAAGVTNGSYFGRIDPDDFPYSQVVLIDSRMDSHILPVGWRFDNPTSAPEPANYPNIRYWEANSRALDGVTPIDCSQRHPLSRSDCNNPLTPAEADFYRNPANILGFTPSEKLTAAVTLSNLTHVYDGTPKPATVTTDPGGLPVEVTYNGSPTAPVNAGTYTVVATVSDANYQGTATGTLTIAKAAATVSLSNLTQVFDGTPRSVTVTTNPGNLSYSALYNGSGSVPSAIGNYAVVVNVTDPNYQGAASGNLNIRSTVKAFPTAEGAGAYAIGGRGGDTYHVTNLNDSGAGSLRNGITTATGPRTIVFDVSGTINLNSRLNINKPFLTIAGQTAPGDGITIAGWTTVVADTQHVIIRYLRFRTGDIRCASGMEGDAFWVDNSKDVIVDHVSASWSIDESLSVTDSDRVTIQWSFITESLNNSCHPEGRHGFGSLIRYGSGRVSYHHNLYAHHNNRNPRVGDNITLDFVNNVIYDWGTDASYSGAANEGITRVNYVGNYLVAGPNTPSNKRARAFNGGSVNTWIYQEGNVIDSNVNGTHDGTNTGWAMFVNQYTPQNTPLDVTSGEQDERSEKERSDSLIEINPTSAEDAYNQVLITAGSSRVRDAVDRRIFNDVRFETGAFIDSQNQVGGFPLLNSLPAPADTDGDGMSDAYESQNGLDPNNPADAAQLQPNGYSNLENYLNGNLFAPTAANVSVAGRVLSANGMGIARAIVTLTSSATSETRTVQTNSFGAYEFADVPSGAIYVVSVSRRRYTFPVSSQVINLSDSLTELDFKANE